MTEVGEIKKLKIVNPFIQPNFASTRQMNFGRFKLETCLEIHEKVHSHILNKKNDISITTFQLCKTINNLMTEVGGITKTQDCDPFY